MEEVCKLEGSVLSNLSRDELEDIAIYLIDQDVLEYEVMMDVLNMSVNDLLKQIPYGIRSLSLGLSLSNCVIEYSSRLSQYKRCGSSSNSTTVSQCRPMYIMKW